jgi:outer membrane lipoprotein-sorting protein
MNPATPALIHERVRANVERIQTLSGSGTVSIESLEMAGSGSFEILLRKPDSLLLKLEGPFGIEVGSALVTRSEFTFYNSLRNQLITGSTNSENLAKTLRMKVTFEDLMNLFTGASFLSEDTEAADDFRVELEQYVLTYRHVNTTRVYWVDPATLLISKIQHLDATGKLAAEQQYTKYLTTAEGSFPASVRYIMNSQRRVLSVFYDEVTVNKPMAALRMEFPMNAERIRIE